MVKQMHTYLALGDSYTIGESVPLYASFPYQTVQLLRKNGYPFTAPEIVAQTGWTSDELAKHLLNMQLNEPYDWVSLLIGVNNQYQSLSIDVFEADFKYLLQKAIHVTGNKANRVIVLSIPDWGATLHARNEKSIEIRKEIDAFNKTCEIVARRLQTHYINITNSTRRAETDATLLAKDQLHYSAKEYAIWANKIVSLIKLHV